MNVEMSAATVADLKARAEKLFKSPFSRGVMVTPRSGMPIAVMTLCLDDPIECAAFCKALAILERAEAARQAGEPR